MAQVVKYFENDVVFKEGPFVVVNANGWRIEVDFEGSRCPVLPHQSIYDLRPLLGFKAVGKFHDFDVAARLCDELNRMVKENKIVKEGPQWVCPVEVLVEMMESAGA